MRESYRVVGLTQGSYCEENPTNHRMATNNICIDAQTLSSVVVWGAICVKIDAFPLISLYDISKSIHLHIVITLDLIFISKQ